MPVRGIPPGSVIRPMLAPSPALAEKSQSSEAGNDRHIESEVVPPARVVHFIDPDAPVEKSDDHRNGGNPAVPDSRKEPRRLVDVVLAVARQA